VLTNGDLRGFAATPWMVDDEYKAHALIDRLPEWRSDCSQLLSKNHAMIGYARALFVEMF